MIYLKSVSSYLDTERGIIYPAFENDTPDMDCPISLLEDEVALDWWESLSTQEYSSTKTIVENLKEEILHEEARIWMEDMNVKYKLDNMISLDEYLYEYSETLSKEDFNEGQKILNSFFLL